MKILTLIIVLILPVSLVSKEQLNILTYDSFTSEWGPGPSIQKSFEETCDCQVNWTTAESSGALLSRVKLTNNKEGFDLILGIDDSLMSEAQDTNLFSPHDLSSSDLTKLNIDWDNKIFVPFDYGYFSFIYNSSNLDNPPKSFDELANRNDIRIIIMDPRTSTPGLGLAKWIYQLKGEQSKDFWKSLQDQIVITAKSWSDGYGLFLEGEGDAVLSYTTSPAYHAIAESDENYKAMLFQDGHAKQIEVMAMLKSAPNEKLAQKFISFAISKGFQNHIPFGNWMYPVIDGLEGSSDFYKFAPMPISLDQVYASKEDKDLWIEYWSSSID